MQSSTPGPRPSTGPWPKLDRSAETDFPPNSPPHSWFVCTRACLHRCKRFPTPSCMHPQVHRGVPRLPQRLSLSAVAKRLGTTAPTNVYIGRHVKCNTKVTFPNFILYQIELTDSSTPVLSALSGNTSSGSCLFHMSFQPDKFKQKKWQTPALEPKTIFHL